MTKANECTCPSGDGSLRHPCPAHPASVELAGVAAKLTFINGRPAMCGCQVEYSSGGGEYSDVIYVTLCAKHSGSAILDLVATNRIALTPEYEGQWHADLYLDLEIPLAMAEGATPAEAVLALMSAERIDPEQESVGQAGGDERIELRRYYLLGWDDRAALAQPSPKCEFCGGTGEISGVEGDDDWVNGPCPRCAYPAQAEAERPVVIARLYRSNDLTMTPFAEVQKPLPMPRSDGTLTVESLMTVAQHERIVGELRAVIAQLRQHKNDYMDSGQETYRALQNEIREREAEIARLDGLVSGRTAERDAALARVAELERQEPVALANRGLHAFWVKWTEAAAGLYGPGIKLYAAPVVQAQHSVPKEFIGRLSEFLAQRGATGKALLRELRALCAAAPGKEGL
ncbi:hypothetical protein [Pseudomonas aeruginosa]|uniref:hypothetical protein n=1 Tax=Pseudomonas aeruginosa TaxID=287 RepID=UPI000A894109|nr:hypothetical protein [Pseudomonas aeruginosa]